MIESRNTISSELLSNSGSLFSLPRSLPRSIRKHLAWAFFLCLFFSLLFSSAYAQGPGLYKGDKKILGLEELIRPSLPAEKPVSLEGETAGRRLYRQVMGEKPSARSSTQKEYISLVLRCRDLVRRISPNHDVNSLPEGMIDELLGLEENLDHANQALLARFSEIGERLRISGFPSEKIERHTDVVERHTALADRLLKLLAGLRAAHTADDALGRENVIRELGQYFTDNIFENTPPLLSSQPLPVMMDTKKAPIVRLDKLPSPAPTRYPSLSKIVGGFDPGDLAPTIDVQFTADIIALADSLNRSPVEFYNFVRDNFEFEAYLGSRKGSQQTLDHRRGNDYDQASLLIAMLRVSGIPARYATGTVEMPIDGATNWLGIDDPVNAASILTTAGMEGVLYYMGPDPYAIRCRRVWVEAWLPFINYRGAINDSTGFMWVPIDPTYKQHSYVAGINFPAEIGFDAEAFVNEYISTFHPQTPIALFERMLLDTLPSCHPGATYDDLITTRGVIKETDGILPGTLPYKLIAKDGQFSEIPSNKRYKIRFHVYGSGTDLDYTTSLPGIAVKQVTISYVGATAADQQIIDAAGGIFNVTEPWLVDLKPVLKIDGCEVARGSGSVMMGVTHYSDMHFTPPTGASNQIPVVYNYIIAGNYQGIGIDTEDALPATFDIPQTSCGEDHLGEELHQAALTYLNNVDVAEDEASRLMHLVVMNDVSEAIVENTVRVLFSGGLPVTFDWTGMIVDADRKIIGPFSVDGMDNDCDYMRLGGADGSIQENRVFETRFGEEAISAIKILELAADSAITVCEITSSIAADCPGINQPSHVINAINSALSQGHHVIIPKREFTYYNWTGTGWIDIDPVTCAAGYIISGGQNGGATVQEWEITYPNLFCIQPIGPIAVWPSPAGDLYCSESNASWIFTVPTIKYWGKDSKGACVLLKSERKDFPVMYTIKEIADTWGPGEYVFRAGSNTSECGCTTIEKTVTIVEIDFPSGDFYLCKDGDRTMSVTVTPGGAPVTFESANPAIATVAGTAFNLTIHGVSAGQAIIRAALNGLQCDTKNIAVLEVKITDPVENPVTDNNFTFNSASPGVCNVTGTGTSGVIAENPNLEWEITAIAGSALTSAPNPPKGPNITFTYTTLPALNAGFGNKALTLRHPGVSEECKDTQTVQIFFDGNDNATNHPGAGAGTTPNWFFYWLQTAAGFGAPEYNPGQALGSIKWENNTWVAVIGHADNDNYTPPAGGDNGGNLLKGIDHFAWVCRHEGRHVQTSTAWYPNGYNGAIDQDSDWMPDAKEPALGGTQQNPISGGPFNPAVTDTDEDGMRDDEDYTVATQTAWTEGGADGQDWANPGHQSNQ